ncbi:hypothetical protein PIB30_004433 [Stylosanthes scabra]|uniref:Uncharacterized protein n=1 Tax=Stylosanthes scabra TaxID=79078 RepID=A0ABU6V3X0_9FABA|nr:hypothetical protein [Stylosanthes scabra]
MQCNGLTASSALLLHSFEIPVEFIYRATFSRSSTRREYRNYCEIFTQKHLWELARQARYLSPEEVEDMQESLKVHWIAWEDCPTLGLYGWMFPGAVGDDINQNADHANQNPVDGNGGPNAFAVNGVNAGNGGPNAFAANGVNEDGGPNGGPVAEDDMEED